MNTELKAGEKAGELERVAKDLAGANNLSPLEALERFAEEMVRAQERAVVAFDRTIRNLEAFAECQRED